MALSFGFFNSVNGDRKYNSRQISHLFDGMIADGVMAHVGTHFAVNGGPGLAVTVGTGRAWFNHTWCENDSNYIVPVSTPTPAVTRTDYLVLEVDERDTVRNGLIKILRGPDVGGAPTLTNTDEVHQHLMAIIYVPPTATYISAENITVRVGTSDCPFATSILESISIDNLFNQWDAEFDAWFEELKNEIDRESVASILTRLQDVEAKNSQQDGQIATLNTNVTNVTNFANNVNNQTPHVGDITMSAHNLLNNSGGRGRYLHLNKTITSEPVAMDRYRTRIPLSNICQVTGVRGNYVGGWSLGNNYVLAMYSGGQILVINPDRYVHAYDAASRIGDYSVKWVDGVVGNRLVFTTSKPSVCSVPLDNGVTPNINAGAYHILESDLSPLSLDYANNLVMMWENNVPFWAYTHDGIEFGGDKAGADMSDMPLINKFGTRIRKRVCDYSAFAYATYTKSSGNYYWNRLQIITSDHAKKKTYYDDKWHVYMVYAYNEEIKTIVRKPEGTIRCDAFRPSDGEVIRCSDIGVTPSGISGTYDDYFYHDGNYAYIIGSHGYTRQAILRINLRDINDFRITYLSDESFLWNRSYHNDLTSYSFHPLYTYDDSPILHDVDSTDGYNHYIYKPVMCDETGEFFYFPNSYRQYGNVAVDPNIVTGFFDTMDLPRHPTPKPFSKYYAQKPYAAHSEISIFNIYERSLYTMLPNNIRNTYIKLE